MYCGDSSEPGHDPRLVAVLLQLLKRLLQRNDVHELRFVWKQKERKCGVETR